METCKFCGSNLFSNNAKELNEVDKEFFGITYEYYCGSLLNIHDGEEEWDRSNFCCERVEEKRLNEIAELKKERDEAVAQKRTKPFVNIVQLENMIVKLQDDETFSDALLQQVIDNVRELNENYNRLLDGLTRLHYGSSLPENEYQLAIKLATEDLINGGDGVISKEEFDKAVKKYLKG